MMNQKTLKRNTQDRIIGGVCSGLARYFDMETWIARLICVLLLFVALPHMVLLYIILWVVIPADTTPDYSEMDMAVEPGTAPPDLEDKNNGNLFLGILLIGLGLLFLLHNYVLWFDWDKLWPVLLIVLGLGILLSGKSKEKDTDEPEIIISSENKTHKTNQPDTDDPAYSDH